MSVRVLLSGVLVISLGCGGSSGVKKDAATDAKQDAPAEKGGDATSADAADVPAETAEDVAPDAAADGDAADVQGDAAASDGDAGDAPTAGDATDAASDGGAGDAPVDGSVEAPPPFDAGAGCMPPPSNQTPLVPATEGIPAAGLMLWLRADRGIYMTPGAGAVCAWADQSGHGHILTPTGTNPTWNPGVVGGKEAVHFVTASAALAVGGTVGVAATSGRTFVAVQQLVSTTHRFEAVFQGQSGTPGTYFGFDTNTFQTAGSLEGVYATNNAYDSTLATSATPRVHLYSISTGVAGTPVLSAIGYRVNGAALTLTRTAGGLGNGNLESFAGANFTAVGAANGDAQVAEVLVYDHALSATDQTAVEAALKARYGIQ